MDKFYLYGSGRDASTRVLRKINPGKNARQVRLGNIVVRPGRRVLVTAAFLEEHASAITAQVAAGYLVVETKPGVRFVKAPDTATDVIASLGDGEGSADTGGGTDEGTSEPTGEAAPEGDAPPAAEATPSAPAPEAEVTPTEPEATTGGAPTGEKEPLPEGWETFVKKDLLALMETYGIKVPENTTNPSLLAAIREWRDA